MINKIIYRYTSFLMIIVFFTALTSGCSKFLEVDPPLTSLTSNAAFENDATAIALMTNVYARMSADDVSSEIPFGSIPTISITAGLGADELALSSVGQNSSWSDHVKMMSFFSNNLETNPIVSHGGEFWSMFSHIYTCNAVLEGVQFSQKLSPNVAKQLSGEAKFMRAFFYFYLANLYGDVPLVLNTDYKKNQTLPRSSKSSVYQQIIVDLKDAKANLSDNFLDAKLTSVTTERVRPTKAAASALLARAYLYTKAWADADTEASNVISNAQFGFVPLNSVFLKNSREAIWQLQPVIPGWNTMDARVFIVPPTGFSISPNKVLYMNPDLYNAFESNDNRKTAWVGSVTLGGVPYRYPAKYKVDVQNAAVAEYTMMLRLSEQYLIRAEARARLGKFENALTDLNAIRFRAGLTDFSTNDQTVLINRIMQERRVELFTELGHRWFDLKRTETIDAVMGVAVPQKIPNGTWKSYQQLYPIPFDEIQNAPSLTQNTGY